MKRKPANRSPSPSITKGDPRGAFYDLFEADEAAELAIRAELLRGLQAWIATADTQSAVAKVLRVTQARVSDLKRGKTGFSLGILVRLAARAGLRPALSLAA